MKYLKTVEAIFWISVIIVWSAPTADSTTSTNPNNRRQTGSSNGTNSPVSKTKENHVGTEMPINFESDTIGTSAASSAMLVRNDSTVGCIVKHLKDFMFTLESNTTNIVSDVQEIISIKQHYKAGRVTVNDMLNLARITKKWLFTIMTLSWSKSSFVFVCEEVMKLCKSLTDECSLDTTNQNQSSNRMVTGRSIIAAHNQAMKSCELKNVQNVRSCMQSNMKFFNAASILCEVFVTSTIIEKTPSE